MARWLPLFVEGLRETENLESAYVALQGAMELSQAAALSEKLVSVLPALIPPLKRAIEVRDLAVLELP